MATAFGITGSTVSRRIFRYPIVRASAITASASARPDPPATKLRAKIEALHLADSGFEFVQRDATRQFASVFSQQQAAVRRGVISRKARKFLVETLKAQAEAERFSILEKKLTSLSHLGRRLRLLQSKSGIGHAIIPSDSNAASEPKAGPSTALAALRCGRDDRERSVSSPSTCRRSHSARVR